MLFRHKHVLALLDLIQADPYGFPQPTVVLLVRKTPPQKKWDEPLDVFYKGGFPDFVRHENSRAQVSNHDMAG